ncbi:uncharacterized protein BKA78DRAFT_91142 [Phyllosticta capitalensis]|uniref:uncharacterized protein n=1 Tax=Phyllosticta capitalensis TaxID=121624 RepID=UPI00312FA62C
MRDCRWTAQATRGYSIPNPTRRLDQWRDKEDEEMMKQTAGLLVVVVCWEQSRAERAGRQAASRFGRKVGIEEDWGYNWKQKTGQGYCMDSTLQMQKHHATVDSDPLALDSRADLHPLPPASVVNLSRFCQPTSLCLLSSLASLSPPAFIHVVVHHPASPTKPRGPPAKQGFSSREP